MNAMKLDAVSIREAAARADLHQTACALITNIDRVYGVVSGLIRQLRPVGFDDLGVGAALEHCVNEWRSRLPSAAIDLVVAGDLQALDETRALVLYRLVQEALTNVARHSGATTVQIRIETAGIDAEPRVEILIADDGAGADLGVPQSGLGLIGMRERVCAQGGSIALKSERGAGFKIIASLPMVGKP